jgi:hypothetical protein
LVATVRKDPIPSGAWLRASQLEIRRDRLLGQLESAEAAISGPEVPSGLPRLFLHDELYRRDMLSAELAWTEGMIAELADGRLTWTREWIAEIAAAMETPS